MHFCRRNTCWDFRKMKMHLSACFFVNAMVNCFCCPSLYSGNETVVNSLLTMQYENFRPSPILDDFKWRDNLSKQCVCFGKEFHLNNLSRHGLYPKLEAFQQFLAFQLMMFYIYLSLSVNAFAVIPCTLSKPTIAGKHIINKERYVWEYFYVRANVQYSQCWFVLH